MIILAIPVVWSNKDVPANFKTIISLWIIVKDWLNRVHEPVAIVGDVPTITSPIKQLIGFILEPNLEQ